MAFPTSIVILSLSSFFALAMAFPRHFFVHVVRESVDGQPISSIPFLDVADNTSFALGYPSAFDNKITLGPDYDSKELGRSQGVFVITHMHGLNSTITINLILYGFPGYIYTSGAFDFSVPDNSMLILGGTGEFLGVRGLYNTHLVNRYPNDTRANSLLSAEIEIW